MAKTVCSETPSATCVAASKVNVSSVALITVTVNVESSAHAPL